MTPIWTGCLRIPRVPIPAPVFCKEEDGVEFIAKAKSSVIDSYALDVVFG